MLVWVFIWCGGVCLGVGVRDRVRDARGGVKWGPDMGGVVSLSSASCGMFTGVGVYLVWWCMFWDWGGRGCEGYKRWSEVGT